MTEATNRPMTTRTYFATTVEAALDLARRELGSDALLVHSRPAPDEVRHLGRYEVVFALENQPTAARPLLTTAGSARPSDSSALRKLLESRGVETPLVRDLLYAALRRTHASTSNREALWRLVKTEMSDRVTVDPRLGRLVLLAGPAGRGKTTTIAKLAVLEGLARKVPVRILSVDNGRLEGVSRLQSLAVAMGISFQRCGSVGVLDQALQSSREHGLTLIDTPGYGPRDFIECSELAAYLSGEPEIDVHLVLRADSRSADVLRTVQMYSGLRPKRIIFTGMDEVEFSGAVFSSIVQSAQPVSFLCFGQRIPQDLEAASKARIIDSIFEGWEDLISEAA